MNNQFHHIHKHNPMQLVNQFVKHLDLQHTNLNQKILEKYSMCLDLYMEVLKLEKLYLDLNLD
ncbi:hypothetical protein TSUD_253190 [Trifolium subterraneum]|nr:hypothetical protein TSUD_253190 [Trifolium subterraneum]